MMSNVILVACLMVLGLSCVNAVVCPTCAPCACNLDANYNPIYNCSQRVLRVIPTCFSASASVIDLSDNLINIVDSDQFHNFPNLQTVLFGNNAITELEPGVFGSVPLLSVIDFSNNQLTSLPAGLFSNFDSIQTLNFMNNKITQLAYSTFFNLPALTSVNLNNNLISSVAPGAFNTLPALQQISMEGNLISSLVGGVFASLPSLTSLDLNDNQITNLPIGVLNLPALQTLDLESNLITNVASGLFTNFPQLTYLDLNGNQITSVPSGVFNLPKLQTLFLSNNVITGLSSTAFANLPSLVSLELYSNQISNLPSGVFANLPALNYLVLAYNNIAYIGSGVLNGSAQLVEFDWYPQTSGSITVSNNAFVNYNPAAQFYCACDPFLSSHCSPAGCSVAACSQQCTGAGASCIAASWVPNVSFKCLAPPTTTTTTTTPTTTTTTTQIACTVLDPSTPVIQCGHSYFDLSSFHSSQAQFVTYLDATNDFGYFVQLINGGLSAFTEWDNGNCTLRAPGASVAQLDILSGLCVEFAAVPETSASTWTLQPTTPQVLQGVMTGGLRSRVATLDIVCSDVAVAPIITSVSYNSVLDTVTLSAVHCSACQSGC